MWASFLLMAGDWVRRQRGVMAVAQPDYHGGKKLSSRRVRKQEVGVTGGEMAVVKPREPWEAGVLAIAKRLQLA